MLPCVQSRQEIRKCKDLIILVKVTNEQEAKNQIITRNWVRGQDGGNRRRDNSEDMLWSSVDFRSMLMLHTSRNKIKFTGRED
jgi:hypothetical protein